MERQGARHLPVERPRVAGCSLGCGERARAASDGAAGQAAAALWARSADRRHVPTLRRPWLAWFGRLSRRLTVRTGHCRAGADAPRTRAPRRLASRRGSCGSRTGAAHCPSSSSSSTGPPPVTTSMMAGRMAATRSSASASRVRAGRSTVRPQRLPRHAQLDLRPRLEARGRVLSQRPSGNFCWGFFPRDGRPPGHGDRYRATVIGPGVMPDMFWESPALGAYDRAHDQAANQEQRQLPATPGIAAN